MKIPIVFTINDNWAKIPTVTCITSLLENAGETFYEIIIVHSGIKDENQTIIQKQVNEYENASIQFIYYKPSSFYLSERDGLSFSLDVYTRLFLSEILPDYDKIIYADADIIFEKNLSPFFQIDLEDNYLAGVIDTYVNDLIRLKKHEGFSSEYLGKYFNAGLIILNLAEIRKDNLIKKLTLEIEKEYEYQDQDIFNVICFGRVKLLDFSFQIFAGEYEVIRTNLLLSIGKLDEYKKARKSPYAFHYISGTKPWLTKKSTYPFKRWWFYYKKSIYHEKELMRKAILNNLSFRNIKRSIIQVRIKKDVTLVKLFGFILYHRL